MKIIAFDINEVREYYLEDDTEKKVKFFVGVLDPYERAYCQSILSKDKKIIKDGDRLEITGNDNTYLAAIETVRLGLKGWEGLPDKKGSTIACKKVEIDIPGVGKRTVLTAESIGCIKPYIFELGLKINTDNTLSEQDSKNSDLP